MKHSFFVTLVLYCICKRMFDILFRPGAYTTPHKSLLTGAEQKYRTIIQDSY